MPHAESPRVPVRKPRSRKFLYDLARRAGVHVTMDRRHARRTQMAITHVERRAAGLAPPPICAYRCRFNGHRTNSLPVVGRPTRPGTSDIAGAQRSEVGIVSKANSATRH